MEANGFDAETALSSQRKGVTGLSRLQVTPLDAGLLQAPAGPATSSKLTHACNAEKSRRVSTRKFCTVRIAGPELSGSS